MDHVLTKVKGRGKKLIFKLISDCTLYEVEPCAAADCIPYNPDHNLDEDAWFGIENFSAQPYCLEWLKLNFDAKDFDELPKEKYEKISYLCAVQGEDYYFQKITPSLFVTKKIIIFGEVAEIEQSSRRLVVNSLPDAIYFKNSDTLAFRNLATISSIFKGIDSLYKEATNLEVKEFLDESFIELTNDYGTEKVSKPNRKRVALAMATLKTFSDEEKSDMFSYIHDYCEQQVKFDAKNSKFEIATDNELKLLLYGIEQRFYTTPFGQEKRLANSIVPLS